MTSWLTGKAAVVGVAGAACLTLFVATRGPADAGRADRPGESQLAIDTKLEQPAVANAAPIALAALDEPTAAAALASEAVDEQAPPGPIQEPSEAKIRAALDDKTRLEFPGVPLTDALQFLADAHEINILVDEQALEDEGISIEDNVNIVLTGVTLRSALDILLARYDLTYVIDDEVMKITTPMVADSQTRLRGYRIGPLSSEFAAGEVSEIVRQLLRADSTATIVPFRDRLLISASLADHMHINEILRLLEAEPGASSNSSRRDASREPIFKVFSLQNADATEMARQIENLVASDPRYQTVRIDVDSRTNQLLVAGTEEQLLVVEALAIKLDEQETTTKSGTSGGDATPRPDYD